MRRPRRCRLYGVAALLGAAVLASASPAVSSPSPVVAPRQAAPTLAFVEQTTWVTEADMFTIRFRAPNAPVDALVQLEVHERLDSRGDFEETLAGELPRSVASMPDQPLALLPPDALRVYEVSYPVGEAGAELDANEGYGVYPVRLVLADAGGAPLAELITYLLLLPDPGVYPPLSVAVVVDVGAPPGLQPDGTVVFGDAELTELSNRIDILDRAPEIPLTVAPVPESLDALSGYGPDGEAQLSLLQQALATGAPLTQVLARPYVDLDIDALVGADMLSQIQPEVDAGARTVFERVDINPIRDVWLTEPQMTEAAATALRDLGIPQAVVSSNAIADVPDVEGVGVPANPIHLTDGGPLALVSDDEVVQRLLGQDGVLDAQRFLADLALIWSATPSRERGVVVRIPDGSALEPATVVEALQGLVEANGQVVQPVTVSDMFATVPPLGGDQPAVAELAATEEAHDDLNGLRGELEEAQEIVNGLAGMLGDQLLIGSLQRSLFVAPGANTPNDERSAYVDRVERTQAAVAAAINAPREFRITLTAREGTIPLTIDNTSDQTVTVNVSLTSSQMEFPDGQDLVVQVPPGGQRVDVTVRTRTSGAFPLGVTITSPDGSIVLDRATFTIRSTAISGVGLVLSVGAALFLLIWWARHWRTARRSSRLVAEHPAGRAARDRALTGQPD